MPPYRGIAEALRDRITSGQVEPGAELPSILQLAQDQQVNRNTAARALTELERMGYATPPVPGAGRRAKLPSSLDTTLAKAEQLLALAGEIIDELRTLRGHGA